MHSQPRTRAPCALVCVCVPALTDAFVSHMAPLRAAPPFDLTPRVPLLHRVVDCLPFALTTMTTSPENVSSIADRLGRLKLTVEANLIDNEDLIGDAGDLPASTVQPVIPVNSITSVTLAQNTPLPRSPPNDASAAPQSGTSDSNSSDPSFSSRVFLLPDHVRVSFRPPILSVSPLPHFTPVDLATCLVDDTQLPFHDFSVHLFPHAINQALLPLQPFTFRNPLSTSLSVLAQ